MDGIGKKKQIVFCDCGGGRILADVKEEISAILQNAQINSTIITDLCGISALKKDMVFNIFNQDADFMVIGCYKRTMELLLKQAGKMTDTSAISEYVNLIEEAAYNVREKIKAFSHDYQGSAECNHIKEDTGWPSWYPVIDYARCTHCGQCADFCLFGVYDKSGDQVNVINPRGCKNNCPACARICPSAAIIFPKYMHGGAIGGSDEIDEKAEQQRQALDIENILGQDLYEALEKRRSRRRSIIRDDLMLKALAERDQALGESTKKY